MKRLILSALACSALAACGDSPGGLVVDHFITGGDDCDFTSDDPALLPKITSTKSESGVYFWVRNTLSSPDGTGVRENSVRPTFVAYQFDCDSDVKFNNVNESFCSNRISDDRDDFEGDQWTAPVAGGNILAGEGAAAQVFLPTPALTGTMRALLRMQVKGVTDSGNTIESPVFTANLVYTSTQTTTTPACWN